MEQTEPAASTGLHPSVTLLSPLPMLERPLLIAAFAGPFGGSAAAALSYVSERWGASPVAEIGPDEYFDFTSLRPTVRLQGDERVIDWPENRFLVARPEGADRDLVLLSGVEPHLRWKTFTEAVASVMEVLGAKESLLLGSFRAATPHTRPVPIRLFGTDKSLGERLGVEPVVPQYQGPTSITGVLGVDHRERGLNTSTLNVVSPFYLNIEPTPHGAIAVIEALDRALGATTNVESVRAQIEAVDEQAHQAMEQSEALATFVRNLEQEYDRSTGVSHQGERLMDEIESFLREQRDVSGPGTPSVQL